MYLSFTGAGHCGPVRAAEGPKQPTPLGQFIEQDRNKRPPSPKGEEGAKVTKVGSLLGGFFF
jgi:hypothetical protein